MSEVDLYQAMFVRHSVHNFDSGRLDAGDLTRVSDYLAEIDQIPRQHATLKIVGKDAVTDSSAPHYILAFSADNAAAYANAGYTLAKADLFLNASGLGAHWMAMPHPKQDRDGYVCLLAFGRTAEPQRAGATDFSRLAVSEISNQDNAIAQAIRLAPSGLNAQPWQLEFDDGIIRIAHHPRGPAQPILKKKVDKVGLGIAARHAKVALEHQGNSVVSITEVPGSKRFTLELRYN